MAERSPVRAVIRGSALPSVGPSPGRYPRVRSAISGIISAASTTARKPCCRTKLRDSEAVASVLPPGLAA